MLSFSPVVGMGTPPTPHPKARCPPPPPGSGGRGTLAGERGGGRVPILTRGHTLWYSVNICTLSMNQFIIPNAETLFRQMEGRGINIRVVQRRLYYAGTDPSGPHCNHHASGFTTHTQKSFIILSINKSSASARNVLLCKNSYA